MTDAHRFPAGWYADPDNPTVHRWWDGARWTEARQPAHGVQAPPPAVAPQHQAQPASSQQHQSQQYQPQQPAHPAQPQQYQPAQPPQPPVPQRRDQPVQSQQYPPQPPLPSQYAQPSAHQASQHPALAAPHNEGATRAYPPAPAYPAAPPAPSNAGSYADGQHAYPVPQGVSDTLVRRDLSTNTVWIWLVVLLPLLTLPTLFLLDWRSFLEDVVRQSTAPGGGSQGWVVSWTAGSLLISLAGWIVMAAQIVFAVLDWRTLRRRGIDRPFHWAWILFVLGGSFLAGVYVIGRSVVLKSRTGTSAMAPVWAWIGALVLSLAVGIGFSIWLINEVYAVLVSAGLTP